LTKAGVGGILKPAQHDREETLLLGRTLLLKRAHERVTISLKLTQLDLDIGQDIAAGNVSAVLDETLRFDPFMRIDMEGSDYTARTLNLFFSLWPRYRNVGVVIQSYLYRSAHDVERLIEFDARKRLVQNAYREPPSVAYQRKTEVDALLCAAETAYVCRFQSPGVTGELRRLLLSR
jgi:proline dehydrogenase